MNPLVSIILPTYNGAAIISRAISSVLAQEYENWELIIVSDGSTDDTKSVIENFSRTEKRIVFVTNEHNEGIQKTLNNGIRVAKGEYIARIDDDDQWVDPLKLSAQVDFLEQNPEYVLVGTDATVADENGVVLSKNIMPKTDKAIRAKILSKNCFLHSTILVKKSVVDTVGGYSEEKDTRHAEDYDLWLKMGAEGKFANLEMKSTILMTHSNSLTSQNRVSQARHVFHCVIVHRKRYPNFLFGYIVSLTRLVFFYLLNVVPIPKSLWYMIQRIYRSV